jgi:hypothetical protein
VNKAAKVPSRTVEPQRGEQEEEENNVITENKL